MNVMYFESEIRSLLTVADVFDVAFSYCSNMLIGFLAVLF